jgi:hypothetical protein
MTPDYEGVTFWPDNEIQEVASAAQLEYIKSVALYIHIPVAGLNPNW